MCTSARARALAIALVGSLSLPVSARHVAAQVSQPPPTTPQHEHEPPPPQPGGSQPHDHGVMTQGAMSHARESSGTAWLPDASPMYAIHREHGAWEVMLHGNLFVQYLDDAGDRGHDQFGSINWVMGMAYRNVGTGRLGLRGMFSLEPVTVRPLPRRDQPQGIGLDVLVLPPPPQVDVAIRQEIGRLLGLEPGTRPTLLGLVRLLGLHALNFDAPPPGPYRQLREVDTDG